MKPGHSFTIEPMINEGRLFFLAILLLYFNLLPVWSIENVVVKQRNKSRLGCTGCQSNIVSTSNWQSSLSMLLPHNSQVTWPNCWASTKLRTSSRSPVRQLPTVHIPINKLKFTNRAFSYAASTIWNGLPTSVASSSFSSSYFLTGTFQTVSQNWTV